MAPRRVTMTALEGVPLVEPGDDLSDIVGDAVARTTGRIESGDILVVAQKVVSKAEGRYVDLDAVEVSDKAIRLAADCEKDPRLVQVILSEAEAVVAFRPGLVIAEHRLGFVMANAGIDESNVSQNAGRRVLLLPEDPDRSARALKENLDRRFGVDVGILISDSFGRPWRNGVVGVAIGCAGVCALRDMVGTADLFGRPMEVTEVATADDLASAAALLMGQCAEATPLVQISGIVAAAPATAASVLVRPRQRDLFR